MLPETNEITLCKAALCQILEVHLNRDQPAAHGRIEVLSLHEYDGVTGATFHITTGARKKAPDAA